MIARTSLALFRCNLYVFNALFPKACFGWCHHSQAGSRLNGTPFALVCGVFVLSVQFRVVYNPKPGKIRFLHVCH